MQRIHYSSWQAEQEIPSGGPSNSPSPTKPDFSRGVRWHPRVRIFAKWIVSHFSRGACFLWGQSRRHEAKINYIGPEPGVAASIRKSFCHRSLSRPILSCTTHENYGPRPYDLINLCPRDASDPSGWSEKGLINLGIFSEFTGTGESSFFPRLWVSYSAEITFPFFLLVPRKGRANF